MTGDGGLTQDSRSALLRSIAAKLKSVVSVFFKQHSTMFDSLPSSWSECAGIHRFGLAFVYVCPRKATGNGSLAPLIGRVRQLYDSDLRSIEPVLEFPIFNGLLYTSMSLPNQQ